MSATQRKAELCGIEATPVARAMPKNFKANLRSALINGLDPGL